MAAESRGDMECRLQREGHWTEFQQRWHKLRDEKKAAGEPNPGSAGYQQAVREFAEPLVSDDDGLFPAAVFKDEKLTEAQQIRWVACNLRRTAIGPADVPNSSVWAMLRWARSSQRAEGEFWTNLCMKLWPQRGSDAHRRMLDETSSDGSSQRLLNMIDKQIRDLNITPKEGLPNDNGPT